MTITEPHSLHWFQTSYGIAMCCVNKTDGPWLGQKYRCMVIHGVLDTGQTDVITVIAWTCQCILLWIRGVNVLDMGHTDRIIVIALTCQCVLLWIGWDCLQAEVAICLLYVTSSWVVFAAFNHLSCLFLAHSIDVWQNLITVSQNSIDVGKIPP